MFLEKLFCNSFGFALLIVSMTVVLGLIVFLFMKKERGYETENFVEDKILENNTNNNVELVETVVQDVEETAKALLEYEILEGEDGFFRVRKVGVERTLRKLSTREEAEQFIKQKEGK